MTSRDLASQVDEAVAHVWTAHFEAVALLFELLLLLVLALVFGGIGLTSLVLIPYAALGLSAAALLRCAHSTVAQSVPRPHTAHYTHAVRLPSVHRSDSVHRVSVFHRSVLRRVTFPLLA